jgi:hypothetical protein
MKKQSPGLNTAMRAFNNLSNNEKAQIIKRLKLNNTKSSTQVFVKEMQSMTKPEMQKLFEILFRMTK